MAKINRFEDLGIWVASINFATDIYSKTIDFKDYYLRDQINRAALSISNNISEGFEYNNSGDFLRFLKFAKGSCGECRNMLIFMQKVNRISAEDAEILIADSEKLSAQIMGFMKYLRQRMKDDRQKEKQ